MQDVYRKNNKTLFNDINRSKLTELCYVHKW